MDLAVAVVAVYSDSDYSAGCSVFACLVFVPFAAFVLVVDVVGIVGVGWVFRSSLAAATVAEAAGWDRVSS